MELRPGYKLTDAGVIPEDWRADTLGPHVEIKSGESPSLFKFESEGVPYFKVEQLNNNNKNLQDTPYFIRSNKKVSRGSLIFPKRGASILLNKIRILEKDSFMDTNLMTLTAKEAMCHEFLYYALAHVELWRIADTTSIPQINNKHITPLVMAFPPKAEQEAIAEALSDADALIESLDQLIAKKREIKQGTMQELLTGKRRLPGFSGEWQVKRVADFGDVITGGTPRTDNGDFWGEGFPWITPTDISRARDISTSERSVTHAGLATIRVLPANTVLVTCIASIGKNAILKTVGGCNQQINAVVPNCDNCAEFLYYLFELNKPYLQANSGTTATSLISKATFQELVFDVPVFSEQTAIATVLSDMDSELAALECRLAKARQIKQGMMYELLTGRIRLI